MTDVVQSNLPPARCPTCEARLVARISGTWCARCKGWLLSYVADGIRRWYVGAYTRGART